MSITWRACVPSSRASDPFAALAHPIRREILGYLRDEPGLTAGSIAERFPRVSRAAVSRHLGVLRGARMVRSRPKGRESHYTLEEQAISGIHEQWCVAFDSVLEGSLERLKEQVEGSPGPEAQAGA